MKFSPNPQTVSVPRLRRRHTKSQTARRPDAFHMFRLLLVMSLPAGLGLAQAQNAEVDELAADQISVRELMRLDTALALSQVRKKLHESTRSSGNAGEASRTREGGPVLTAIYGVGKKLAAEVRVGTRTYVYMRGHPFPVGQRTADKAGFVLRGMDNACVRLEKEARELELCLAGRPGYGG